MINAHIDFVTSWLTRPQSSLLSLRRGTREENARSREEKRIGSWSEKTCMTIA